ncbi:MAG TPA: ATP-binding protein [Acidobacteriaceae bacterium]|nr:ATP-binding protein [Acidobacteriaceae bacterium]
MVLYLLVTLAGLFIFDLMSLEALRYASFQGKEAHLQGREDRLLSMLEEKKEKKVTAPLVAQLQEFALVTHEGNLFHIHNHDGSMFFPASVMSNDWALFPEHNCEQPQFSTVTVEKQPILVMCHNILLNGTPVVLHIGGDLKEETYILQKYRRALILLMPALVILSSFSGYFLSRYALKPVDRLTRAALGIGVGNLSQRLPVPQAKDELQNLAIAWNQLLTRLEAAITRLSRFSADASHDLRTSITVMLATAQLSLRRHRSTDEHRDALAKVVTECRTASTLLDSLLSVAQSDNFIHEVAFTRINLCDLVVNGCRRVEDLAESSGILLDWHLPSDTIYIDGDDLLLQRLLGILLDNAIRYTPDSGEIRAEISTIANYALITVRDTGIGMSEDTCRQVFDRFYQADLRERRSNAGNGLGLAIGKWIADAHGAELTVESAPMRGSIFQIKFPLPMETSLFDQTPS